MPHTLDRRRVIVAGSALVAATRAPGTAPMAGSAPAADLLAATRKFLDGLEPDKRKAASFAWDGSEWRSWNYFGVGGFIKPGLRLEQMSAAQKEAAWNLLATLFSPAGIEKTRNVMTLQDVLAASGNGAGQRSSQRFSFAVFGDAGRDRRVGLPARRTSSDPVDQRARQPHRGGHAVLVLGAARRITSGKHAGLMTLKDEEALARRLAADLAAKPRVRQSERRSTTSCPMRGASDANAQKVGIAAADLTAAQRDLLWQLVDTYSVSYLAPALAAAQKDRVRAGDRDAVHFAWYGANTPEKAFGYRVIGDGFVIELGSVDAAAQHLHTIYNDLDNVLGRTN